MIRIICMVHTMAVTIYVVKHGVLFPDWRPRMRLDTCLPCPVSARRREREEERHRQWPDKITVREL